MKLLPAPMGLLLGLALITAAAAQNIPGSMVYPSAMIVRIDETDQDLLIADPSLMSHQLMTFDLSTLPVEPDSFARHPQLYAPLPIEIAQKAATAHDRKAESISKLQRSAALMAFLGVAYLATCKRPNARRSPPAPQLGNLSKKPLADREAHA